ncbi:hypothetical protein ACFELO_06175 [Oceanicaulis sp. LC35]|uniref:hypothetical protein n=1 Tax=Oceanicaulis sp. LC35 TaxID=3349635 RepID=UPI003F87F9CC
MATLSASFVSSLYNAGALASGASKRAASAQGQPAPKASTEVQDRLSEALNAMKRAPDEQKQASRNRARERVEAVREQLKIIKELYAQNPKEMAKALRHLVKELKSALKAYKDAGGDMNAVGSAGLMAMAASPAAPDTTNTAAGEDASANGEQTDADVSAAAHREAEADASTEPEEDADPAVPDAVSNAARPQMASRSVDELDARLGELMGDEEFVRSVDGLKRKIQELFETAKIQSAFLAKDKARDNAFEALDEDLEALDEDVTEYKRDVQDELIAVRLEIKMIERGELSVPVSLDLTA